MNRKAADFTFKVSKFQMTLGIELFRFFNKFVTPCFKVTNSAIHRIHCTKFGWVNSPFYLAIWVHCAFATETYFVYQLVQFMRNVPRDLDEAAAIDGCSSFQTLYKVIVPMLMPALVSCALFQFMWSCNDFMGPLLYVQTPAKYPMSLFVKLSMDGDTGFAWNRILALSLISILPQLIVFFCAQDQFVEGISAGAVKG